MPIVSVNPYQLSDIWTTTDAANEAGKAYWTTKSNRDYFKALPKNITDANKGIAAARAALENSKALRDQLSAVGKTRALTDDERQKWDEANVSEESLRNELANWTSKLKTAQADYERLKGTDWDLAFRQSESAYKTAQTNLTSAQAAKEKWAKTPQGVAYYKEHANDPWADKPWVRPASVHPGTFSDQHGFQNNLSGWESFTKQYYGKALEGLDTKPKTVEEWAKLYETKILPNFNDYYTGEKVTPPATPTPIPTAPVAESKPTIPDELVATPFSVAPPVTSPTSTTPTVVAPPATTPITTTPVVAPTATAPTVVAPPATTPVTTTPVVTTPPQPAAPVLPSLQPYSPPVMTPAAAMTTPFNYSTNRVGGYSRQAARNNTDWSDLFSNLAQSSNPYSAVTRRPSIGWHF